MRWGWLILASVVLAGCATRAEREMERLDSVAAVGSKSDDACMSGVKAMPEYAMVRGKMDNSLAAQADQTKPTPAEVRSLYAVHSATAICRKGVLETASKLNPALVPPIAEGYAAQDEIMVDLVSQRETWGGANRRFAAAKAQASAKLQVAAGQILRGLNQSHQAELQRRQNAANALSQWAQNQQIIAAMNQPRYTNCTYIGVQLSCVSQ